MFESTILSNYSTIFVIFFVLSYLVLHYLKFHHLLSIGHRCQKTREKLHQMNLSTDLFEEEYNQCKQILSSSITNCRKTSLIDEERLQTLEYLNRKLREELTRMKESHANLRQRLKLTSQDIFTIRSKHFFPQFPFFPPWIRTKLPMIPEDKPFDVRSLPSPVYFHGQMAR